MRPSSHRTVVGTVSMCALAAMGAIAMSEPPHPAILLGWIVLIAWIALAAGGLCTGSSKMSVVAQRSSLAFIVLPFAIAACGRCPWSTVAIAILMPVAVIVALWTLHVAILSPIERLWNHLGMDDVLRSAIGGHTSRP